MPYSCLIIILSLIMFKTNQPKETMTKKDIKKDHKYIGYHNTKEVCSATHWNPISAKFLCEEKLLNYFHEITPSQTKYGLDQYLGQVSYAGYKEIDA